MDCLVPGRVILSPAVGRLEEYEGRLREEAGTPFELEYSVADILGRYELARRAKEGILFDQLPRIARIPEGEEKRVSRRLGRTKLIDAAVPDYLVRPQSAMIDLAVIDKAIGYVGAEARSSRCGEGVRIAILDSGLDLAALSHPPPTMLQYDVRDPADRGKSPSDPSGHGSVVAAIINRIAPAAEIIPIQTFRDSGTVSDVLAGLYLSAAMGPCDLVNLSLAVSCDVDLCPVCDAPNESATSGSQLRFFFDQFLRSAPATALVAAAGNDSRCLTMPASFGNIFAVGDFDVAAGGPSPNSNYNEVPADRYLLAPGSRRGTGQSFGSRPHHRGEFYFSGTSFAAAFVTGIAARYVCSFKDGPCSWRQGHSGNTLFEGLRAVFADSSRTDFPGYDPARHGLGTARYAYGQ